jgi:hypothetical protein
MDSFATNNVARPINFVPPSIFLVDFPFDPTFLLTCAHAHVHKIIC